MSQQNSFCRHLLLYKNLNTFSLFCAFLARFNPQTWHPIFFQCNRKCCTSARDLFKDSLLKRLKERKKPAQTVFEPRTSGLQSKSLNNHFPNWNTVTGKYNLSPKKLLMNWKVRSERIQTKEFFNLFETKFRISLWSSFFRFCAIEKFWAGHFQKFVWCLKHEWNFLETGV